jgi:hypothetical protein
MAPIKAIFKFNKLLYTLLKRNEYVALYGIGGTPEKEAERFEVFKIIIDNDDSGIIESLPSNDPVQIRENYLQCFNDFESALNYYDELTYNLKLYQGVSKVVTGLTKEIKMAA